MTLRVVTEPARPGEPVTVALDAPAELTVRCTVGGRTLLAVRHALPAGEATVPLPPGPATHPGRSVAVTWTFEVPGADPVPVRVLPGRSAAPTVLDRLATIEPVVRGIVDTIVLGAFVLGIFGVATAFFLLDPSVPVLLRLGGALVMAALLVGFAWAPVTTVVDWIRAALVPIPPLPGPLAPGATWTPRTRQPWRLDLVESEHYRVRRSSGGTRWYRWLLHEERVSVQHGEPGEPVRIPTDGPVNARAGRAAVTWEWVTWRPENPGVERRIRLDVR